MARYAIVVGGVVVNVIEASPEFVASLGGTAIASAAAGPGDSWNGTAFTAQTPALVVPQSVSMAQARIAMARASISEAAVAAAIANMAAGQAKTEADIWWRTANEVHRNSTAVAGLAPLLGLNSTQIDALFIAAAAVTP